MAKSKKNEYITAYNAANMKQIKINLNRQNPDDARIIAYLETVDNVQGLIKNLIREHMK